MNKNNELDFNFDNTPFTSASTSSRPNVDRTVDRAARVSKPTADKKPSTYRWGSASAPSTMLTPDEIMHLNDTPSKKDNPHIYANKTDTANHVEPESIQMTRVKREVPSVVAEPTPTESGYSNAALEIMRRMQNTENSKVQSVTDKSDSPSVSTSKAESATNTPTAADKIKSEPAKTEDEAIIEREKRAENFEIDVEKMAEGMQELELEMTQVFGIENNADTSDGDTDGGTRMFSSISNSANAADDSSTRHVNIPDAVDILYGNDENSEYESDEDKPYIDEYNSVEDAQSVARDLAIRKGKLTARTVISAIITILLIAITCSDSLFPFGQPPYFIAVGVLLGIAVITNISSFSALISVFTLKNDVDFAPAFAVFAAAVQTAVSALIGTDGMAYTSMFAAAAVLSLTAGTFAKRLTVGRTLANFELIANEDIKQAGDFIAPPQSGYIADVDKIGESLIFGRRDTIDLKGFISYSLSPDHYEKLSGKMSLVILLASLISFAVALLTENTMSAGVSMLASTACAGAQIAFIYPCAVQLSRSCRRLRQHKVMLSGIKAADEISEANVVVLDSDELFFDNCVNLYKFRTFGDFAPDDAFMTAYALTLGGHSPLAGMFGKICETQSCGMYKADSIVYENSMGITGWVEERKTLLGNRMIMESHSIPVPSMEVDRKILQSGKFPVYLAVDNKIAALFIVGYESDKSMLHRMRRLINTGVTVLVRTVDPNVTADLVCSQYGLPSDSVIIMESNASHLYCEKMQTAESTPARLTAPNAQGFVDAYIESYAISRRNKVTSVVVVVISCIMMALTVILPAIGMTSAINILSTLVSHAVTLVISAIIMAFLG